MPEDFDIEDLMLIFTRYLFAEFQGTSTLEYFKVVLLVLRYNSKHSATSSNFKTLIEYLFLLFHFMYY